MKVNSDADLHQNLNIAIIKVVDVTNTSNSLYVDVSYYLIWNIAGSAIWLTSNKSKN